MRYAASFALMFATTLLVALLTPTAVHATGFGGDAPPTRIPVPAKVVSAVVEDQGGTLVKVERISLDGEVYVHGTHGEGQVAIPFDKIAEVRIEPSPKAGKIVAFVKMREGESIAVTIDDDTPCWGKTTYGNYKIEISKVRRIEFAAP